MKILIYRFRVAIAVFICFWGIALSFMFAGQLSKIIARVFNLKLDPGFTGGTVAAVIDDEENDDAGCGNLVYPQSSQFKQGCLDLVEYTVHQPVYNAIWQTHKDYWALDMDFASEADDVRNITVYFGIKNKKENPKLAPLASSAATLFKGAENVSFNKEYPWNFVLWIAGSKGRVFDAGGNFITDVQMNITDGGRKVQVRIPLYDKNLQRLYTAEETFHYVLCGAYSDYEEGGFMAIESNASLSRGSVKNPEEYNPQIPKVYDVLGSNKYLAAAELMPVSVEMTVSENSK